MKTTWKYGTGNKSAELASSHLALSIASETFRFRSSELLTAYPDVAPLPMSEED